MIEVLFRRHHVGFLQIMKRLPHIAILGLLLFLLTPSCADAQPSSLYLVGAPSVRLNARVGAIATATAKDSDDTTSLVWNGQEHKSKVTVSTFSPGQKFDLYVEAIRCRNGKSAGPIKLVDGMMAANLIVNIRQKKKGSAIIRYSVEARLEQGNTDTDLTDVHTVTYTITDQ